MGGLQGAVVLPQGGVVGLLRALSEAAQNPAPRSAPAPLSRA